VTCFSRLTLAPRESGPRHPLTNQKATSNNNNTHNMKTGTVIALVTSFAQLAQGQSQAGTEFHTLKKLLQSRYGDMCEQRVVGRETSTPTTQVNCTEPGGTAFMQAAGIPPGPTPQFLKVCTIGSEGVLTCDKIRFRGNVANDIEKATELLNGHNPRQFSDFSALVELLNEDYGNTCINSTVSGIMSNTTVNCTKPGGSASLTVITADTYPSSSVPATLTVCMYGADMQTACNSINLTGAKFQDLSRAKQLIMSNLTQPTEFQQIVSLLYSVYNSTDDCHTSLITLPPSPTEESIQCVRPGGNATLSAEQTTSQADPVPQSLQVCMLGSFGNARCQNVNFVGSAAKDVAAAQFLLGIE
jgi:hypothetical protein